jgi:hypothetical protein
MTAERPKSKQEQIQTETRKTQTQKETKRPKPVQPPEGYVTIAQAAEIIGVDQWFIRRWIQEVDIDTGERRLPAKWVEAPVGRAVPPLPGQPQVGGYYLLRLADVVAFSKIPRHRGGGKRGVRGNAQRYVRSPIRQGA